MERLASGVDMSKASFVGAVWVADQAVELGQFDNNTSGFAAMQQALVAQQRQQRASQIHLVVEPTGGYELGLHPEGTRFAYEQGWAVSLPNPRQVREWAKGIGKRAKTDRVDARLLAQFAAQRRPPAQPPGRKKARRTEAWIAPALAARDAGRIGEQQRVMNQAPVGGLELEAS